MTGTSGRRIAPQVRPFHLFYPYEKKRRPSGQSVRVQRRSMNTIRESSRTVLIGEDEIDVQAYLEIALNSLGYSVITAQDGNDVIQQLCSQSNIIPVLGRDYG